jgi:hypothetical protein
MERTEAGAAICTLAHGDSPRDSGIARWFLRFSLLRQGGQRKLGLGVGGGFWLCCSGLAGSSFGRVAIS